MVATVHEHKTLDNHLVDRYGDGMRTTTYADEKAFVTPIAADLERIAYRLRQGAISHERAAEMLTELAAKLVTT